MNEITRIALPPLFAQSEQLARVGGGRAFGAPELVQRDEDHQRLVALSRRSSEEVQATARVEAAGQQRERAREHAGGGRRRWHYGPHAERAPDGEDEHLLDVTA